MRFDKAELAMSVKPMTSCIFATYARNNINKSEDALIIKERIRNPETGEERPRLRIVPNYKRKVWITQKGLRNHKQKKDFEFITNCVEFECTQAQLPRVINRALGFPMGEGPRLRELCRSPYVYGTDVSPTVLYKQAADDQARKLNGNWNPLCSVAVIDFETNVLGGREAIISGAVSYKDKAVVAVTEEFLGTLPNAEEEFNRALNEYLGKYVQDRKMTVKLRIVKNDMEVVRTLMMTVHALKPDFLTGWNLKFDINKMIETCEYYNVDPAQIFSDPSIPPELRFFNFREDQLIKTTASGKAMPKHWADLWHVVEAPASFYVIDAACVFKMLRIVQGMRPSYSLDAILGDELGISKLQIPGVGDGEHNLPWHRMMQRFHKIAYLIYNLFDCISVELLDEKTGDLARKIPVYADGSDFASLRSNPRRLTNAIHFYLLEQGKVLCSTSDDMTEEFDSLTLSKRNWIVTLANELVRDTGVFIETENYRFRTRAAPHVADIDITSGYPTTHVVANVAKSTTLVEVCKMGGLPVNELRRIAVNLTALPANSVDIGRTVLGLPDIQTLAFEFVQTLPPEKQAELNFIYVPPFVIQEMDEAIPDDEGLTGEEEDEDDEVPESDEEELDDAA